MFSLRMVVGSALTALLSGTIGFASASYLQRQASDERIRELENQQILAEAAAERLFNRERTWEAYHAWTGQEQRAKTRTARLMLDRHSGRSIAEIAAASDVTQQEMSALRDVFAFWSRIDDLAAAGAIDTDLARRLLEPDARAWAPTFYSLARSLNCEDPGEAGVLAYAALGARRLDSGTAVPADIPSCLRDLAVGSADEASDIEARDQSRHVRRPSRPTTSAAAP